MKRIIVVGTTGSGKSTFAKKLAAQMAVPYIQLDKLFWKPRWEESRDDEFFRKIDQSTNLPHWVVDGNYDRTNHIHWNKAQVVVWLDLPLWLTLFQSISRSVKRARSGDEIWEGTGNRESFGRMFSSDSIILWLLKTYHRNVRKYEERLSAPEYSHLKFVRLRSRREMAAFLSQVDCEGYQLACSGQASDVYL